MGARSRLAVAKALITLEAASSSEVGLAESTGSDDEDKEPSGCFLDAGDSPPGNDDAPALSACPSPLLSVGVERPSSEVATTSKMVRSLLDIMNQNLFPGHRQKKDDIFAPLCYYASSICTMSTKTRMQTGHN